MDNYNKPKKVYKAETPEEYDRRMVLENKQREKEAKEKYEKLSPEQKERVDKYKKAAYDEFKKQNDIPDKSKWQLFGRARPY